MGHSPPHASRPTFPAVLLFTQHPRIDQLGRWVARPDRTRRHGARHRFSTFFTKSRTASLRANSLDLRIPHSFAPIAARDPRRAGGVAMRLRFLFILLVVASIPCLAGRPAFVAGSGFDPSAKGRSLTCVNGRVQYFTDQGDLSPVLTNTQADAFVADAFTRWTTISAALSVSQTGHLAEDVSGAYVTGYPDGTYSIPVDIQSAAIATPIGIVYDRDGRVTDALLGVGAGDPSLCFTNAVYRRSRQLQHRRAPRARPRRSQRSLRRHQRAIARCPLPPGSHARSRARPRMVTGQPECLHAHTNAGR